MKRRFQRYLCKCLNNISTGLVYIGNSLQGTCLVSIGHMQLKQCMYQLSWKFKLFGTVLTSHELGLGFNLWP